MNVLLPVLTSLVLAAPAAAQQRDAQAGPTVAGYLCTFAGKCDGQVAPEESRAAPDTKGFRLARPAAAPAEATKPMRKGRRYAPAASGYTRPARAPSELQGRSSRAYAATSGAVAPAGRPGARADLMIGFELNSARLTGEGTHAAQVFARSLLLPELRDKRFLIEGHTDVRGGRALNATLSAQRAQAVADYLVVLGVDRNRLETRGYGATVPLPGRRVSDPANRRVEAELIR